MSSSDAASQMMIVLESSDGVEFEVEEAVADKSEMIKGMIEGNIAYVSIPLPKVTSKIPAKVIEFCKRHVDAEAKASGNGVDEDLKSFDAAFVKVDQETLLELFVAANYLKIKSLRDLTCQSVADKIKGKSPEEIRMFFNIERGFTPEEEDVARREKAGAFK